MCNWIQFKLVNNKKIVLAPIWRSSVSAQGWINHWFSSVIREAGFLSCSSILSIPTFTSGLLSWCHWRQVPQCLGSYADPMIPSRRDTLHGFFVLLEQSHISISNSTSKEFQFNSLKGHYNYLHREWLYLSCRQIMRHQEWQRQAVDTWLQMFR